MPLTDNPTPLAKGEPIITDLAPASCLPPFQIPREEVIDLRDLLEAVIRFGTYVTFKADRNYDVSEIVGCELPPLLERLEEQLRGLHDGDSMSTSSIIKEIDKITIGGKDYDLRIGITGHDSTEAELTEALYVVYQSVLAAFFELDAEAEAQHPW